MKVCKLRLGFSSILLICVAVEGVATSSPPGQRSSYDPIVYSHLIMRGMLKQVTTETVPMEDWIPATAYQKGQTMMVYRLTISVDEVLKGHVDGDEIVVRGLLDGSLAEALWRGSEQIFCVSYERAPRNSFVIKGAAVFTLSKGAAVFTLSEGNWIREFDQQTFTTRELWTRVKESKIESVIEAADAIVSGVIETEDSVESPEETFEFALRVDSVLKGSLRDKVVKFKMVTKEAGSMGWKTLASWRISVGDECLVFLKKDEIGYYTFSGANSLFKIEEGKLYFDNKGEFMYGKSELGEIIVRELKGAN